RSRRIRFGWGRPRRRRSHTIQSRRTGTKPSRSAVQHPVAMSHPDDPQDPRDPSTGANDARTGDGGRTPADAGHRVDEVFAAFVDGSADAEERQEVERHLAGCGACTADVAAARHAHNALQGIPEVDSPWTGGVDPLVAAATAPAPATSIKERR